MKSFIFSCFFLFSSFVGAVEDYEIIENQAKLPILTPSYANYKTLKLKLANGLEAYIVSDPVATKSGAVLVIDVGSWNDPKDAPGLAHFLEHMLFLGTKKYPKESEYQEYVNSNDGEANAYTAPDHTLYVFSINNNAFENALDRFSRFFKEPLFNPSGVDRELQAINQEFAKSFTDDDVREYYIAKELSEESHPFHSFSSGNAASLATVSQDTLKEWYKKNYSADHMHLMVYSPLPLDTLTEWVVNDFKDIPKAATSSQVKFTPFTTEERKKVIVYIEPLKNIRTLNISWELPPQFAHMKDSKPMDIVCAILGHEGPGSLLALLKKENLAESLSCAGYYFSPDNYLLSLDIELTEQGLEKSDFVIQRTFEMIQLMKQQQIPDSIYDEFKKIATIRYQYQSRIDPFHQLMKRGEGLIRENLATFPEQSLIIQKNDPEAVKDLLNFLTPQNAFMSISAKPELSKVIPEKKEKWMQVPYALRPITEKQFQQWSEIRPNISLALPTVNPFVPDSISIPTPSNQPISLPKPETIVDDKFGKIYFAKDTNFSSPQTVWFFEISTPLINKNNPTQSALTDLYTRCLEEALNPFTYDAKIADLDYKIQQNEKGLSISLKGYQDNTETLFEVILKKLKYCQPTKESFALYKDSLLRQYQNFEHEGPLKQGIDLLQSLIYKSYSTKKQKAEALAKISYEDLLNFSHHLFGRTYTTGLFYGNIEKDQAIKNWDKLQNTLGSAHYPINEQPNPKTIVLPNQGPYHLSKKISGADNASILLIEDPDFTFKKRAAQQIISTAMSTSFYNELRTTQQTGYIVDSNAEELERHLFNFFAVQSSSHAPRDLLARFELFLESFLQELGKSQLTKEQYQTIHNALLTTLELFPQNLMEMGDLLKTLVFKYDGDFDWTAKRINGFKELSYEDVITFAKQTFGKNNKRRIALLIEGQAQKETSFNYKPLDTANELREISTYNGSKE